MDDFLEGIKWLEEDHRDENGKLTRELGCTPNGTLVKIKRIYDPRTARIVFYNLDSQELWFTGNGNVSISKDDAI